MGFLSFFWSSPLGVAVGAIVTVAGAAVIFAGVNVILAFSGGPGDCTPGGGTITVNDANAQAFQDKWDAFDAQLDGGAPSSVPLNESEVTSGPTSSSATERTWASRTSAFASMTASVRPQASWKPSWDWKPRSR